MEKSNSMLPVLKDVLWTGRSVCAVVARTVIAACLVILVVSHMGGLWDERLTSFAGMSAFIVTLAAFAYAWKCVCDIIALKGGDGKEEPEAPVQKEPVKENTDEKPTVLATRWNAVPVQETGEIPCCYWSEAVKALDRKAETLGVGLHKAWHATPKALDEAFEMNVKRYFGDKKGAAVEEVPEEGMRTLKVLCALYHTLHRGACCADNRLRVLRPYRIEKSDGTVGFVLHEVSDLYGSLDRLYDAAAKSLAKCRKAIYAFGAPNGVVAAAMSDAAYLEDMKDASDCVEAILESAEASEPVREEVHEAPEKPAEEASAPTKKLPPHPKARAFKRAKGDEKTGYIPLEEWSGNEPE